VFHGFDELEKQEESNNGVIFIGDTQGTSLLEFWREDNKEKTPLLIQEIAGREPACVINLGDLVFCGTSRKQWALFDKAHLPLLDKNIPYFPMPGNHEYWCNPKKTFKNYFSRFPHLENRKWYSFQFQNTGFLMLDTNFSRLDDDEKRFQLEWYREKLCEFHKDGEILYIIVCCHNPPYTNSKVVKPSNEVRCDYVEPFLELEKTAAFFSGHCHSYEKFVKEGKYFIVSGGGGGPRQKLNTDKETRRFNDLYPGDSLRFLNFCQMKIEPNKLCFEVTKLTDGGKFEKADEFSFPIPPPCRAARN
jgi:3',5'-cyclic AMP phosphodiesterase CpdA